MISTASSGSAWRHPEEFSIVEQLFVGIYLAFCLRCYIFRNTEKRVFYFFIYFSSWYAIFLLTFAPVLWKETHRRIHTSFSIITPEFKANRRHFKWRFQKSSYQNASSVRLGDVTPVLLLHRIAESVSPSNLMHLAQRVCLWIIGPSKSTTCDCK